MPKALSKTLTLKAMVVGQKNKSLEVAYQKIWDFSKELHSPPPPTNKYAQIWAMPLK